MERFSLPKRRRCFYLPSIHLLILLGIAFPISGSRVLSEAAPFLSAHPATSKINFYHVPSLWGLRGGSTEMKQEDSAAYTAIGVQVVGGNAPGRTTTFGGSANYMLLKGDSLLQPSPSSEQYDNTWNGDDIAVETLAIGCDIMVLIVEIDSSKNAADKMYMDPKFVRALERGLRQRAENGMKSSLLVLLTSSGQPSFDLKMSPEKDRLLLQDLERITPSIASNLDILSLEDPEESDIGLDTSWKEILRDTEASLENTTSCLVEAATFPLLLHSIYKSKGGKQAQFLTQLEESLVTTKQSTTDTVSPIEALPISSDEEPVVIDKETTHDEAAAEEAIESIVAEDETRSVLANAFNQIRDLEAKQEELWLGFSSEDDLPGSTSYMGFGPAADRIIDQFQSSIPDQDQVNQLLFQQVLPPLNLLYEQHLNFLREQCGKQYEAALETTASNPEEYQNQWKEAAGKITTSFREAARSAIPIQCREGAALRDADFEYVPVLEGLLQDMMQATEEQEELLGITAEEDNDEDEEGQGGTGAKSGKKQQRPAKWYHKVAAKAVVFGVNYLQGWLAYQGIKRAAAQRDMHLPKFPLF
jgi:hypothetical protein